MSTRDHAAVLVSTSFASGRGRLWRGLLRSLLLLGVTALNAQVWTGALSSTWSTGGNWSGGVPGGASTATFSSNTANDPNLTAATTTGRLVFNSGADAETFTGSALSLTGFGGPGIDNQSGLTQTFNNTLVVAGSQTWNAGSGNLTFSTVTLSNSLTLTGPDDFNFNGTLTNTNGNRTLTNNAGGSVTLGNVNLSNNNTARTLTFGGTGDTLVGGVIGNGGTGAGNLVKTGTGTLTLAGANTYTGTTTIGSSNDASGGTLRSGASNTIANNIVTVFAGTLDLNGNNDTIGALNLGGGAAGTSANVTTGAGTLTLGGNLTYSNANNANGASVAGTLSLGGGNRTFTVNDSSAATTDLTISANITAANRNLTVTGAGNTLISGDITTGSGTLTKSGTGTLTLAGANTYTGATTVSAGTLQLGASNVIANSSAVTVASGAVFDVNDQTETIASLAGAGTVDLGTGTLVSAGNASTTFSGALTGTGEFTKQGTGTLTLSNDFAFDGTFNLAAGTLRLSDISLTLGTLNITGNSFLDFAGTASALSVTHFSIAAGVTLTIQNWANATDYFFAQNWTGASFNVTGANPMNQVTFTGFNASNTKWQEYDTQITPVPEPSTYGALLLGFGSALLAWRRRTRK